MKKVLPFIIAFRLKVFSTTVTFSVRRLIGLVLTGIRALCPIMRYTIIPVTITKQKYRQSFDPPVDDVKREKHHILPRNDSLSCELALVGKLIVDVLVGINDRLRIMIYSRIGQSERDLKGNTKLEM